MTSASVAGLATAHAVAELDQVAGSIETVFLEAGERLGDAVTRWRAISASFASLAGQYEGEEMRRCVDGLRATLSMAGTLGSQAGGSAAGLLGELGGALKNMESRLNRLSKTVAEVKLVALNAKVEAAHLDAGRLDFTVFTREIDRLVANAAAELAVLAGELRSLAGETAAAHQAQAGFNDSHGSELQAVCRRLDEGLQQLAGQRQRSANAAALIGTRSSAAGDHIAEVVSALQIGDITRQRTEHVTQALELLADLAAHAPGLAPEDYRQAAALVSSLQATQLEQSAADLDHETAEVTANLAALAREAEEVARLGQDSFGGSGGASFLDGLAGEMARIQQLLERYAGALANTEAAMRSVTHATGAMVAHVEAVHSIEADLKIMALNASFKCSRLGPKGRTLSVVAQNLRQLATRTVEDAGALMDGLKAAMATAETLAHGQGDGGEIATALASLREAAALLATNGADQDGALCGLEADSARAQALLNEAVGHITRADDFSRRLREAALRLRETAKEVEIDPERAEELKSLVLANLSGNYTMASERSLHDLFGGGANTAAAAEAAPVDLDDILF
ncbi:MAG: hypothetical protein NVV74_13395 [Magnetospirillum sp.]|nr:hypothetical protein [Magnetospirillum sp.]